MNRQPSFALRMRGMSIVGAIFILVLLSTVAAMMVRLTSTAHVTSAEDFEGSRAYQAARAGIEWGLFQLDPNDTTSTLPACFGNTTLTQIPNYTVTVQCSTGAVATYTEGSREVRIFQVSATAVSTSAFPVAVERRIDVTAEKCRDPGIGSAPYGC